MRKLEFLIAEALRSGHDSVLTLGGIQSNHARATAVSARCPMSPFSAIKPENFCPSQEWCLLSPRCVTAGYAPPNVAISVPASNQIYRTPIKFTEMPLLVQQKYTHFTQHIDKRACTTTKYLYMRTHVAQDAHIHSHTDAFKHCDTEARSPPSLLCRGVWQDRGGLVVRCSGSVFLAAYALGIMLQRTTPWGAMGAKACLPPQVSRMIQYKRPWSLKEGWRILGLESGWTV